MLIVLMFGLSSISFAQGIYNIKTGSAYQQMDVESKSSYNYRKSQAGKVKYTYYSYDGPKDYIFSHFISRNNKTLAFYLYENGRISYWQGNREREGRYFIGEKMYYKTYKVYIRWNDGALGEGKLDYSERSDGRPVLGIKESDGAYRIYIPQ